MKAEQTEKSNINERLLTGKALGTMIAKTDVNPLRQEPSAYLLLELNSERNNFKYPTIQGLLPQVYPDFDPVTASVLQAHNKLNNFKYSVVVGLIKKLPEKIDLEQENGRYMPRIMKWIGWLVEQPEYQGITKNDLILVFKRQLSFVNLRLRLLNNSQPLNVEP